MHNPHALWMYMFRSMYITTLHCCSFCLAHFLRSSICSTSLDSSTTLPLTIVCVTTFTIFRVLTSGSSAKESKQVTLLGRQNTFIFHSILFFHFTTYRAEDIHSFLLSQMLTGIQTIKWRALTFGRRRNFFHPVWKDICLIWKIDQTDLKTLSIWMHRWHIDNTRRYFISANTNEVAKNKFPIFNYFKNVSKINHTKRHSLLMCMTF